MTAAHPPRDARDARDARAAGRATIRTIVVPLDGSGRAEAALPVAAGIARAAGAALHLVRVHEPVYAGGMPAVPPGAVGADRRAQDAGYLARLAAECADAAGGAVGTFVEDGDVAEGIARRADALHADLVVLTSHGRTGARRVWLGSVADRIVHAAACPVLLLHAGGEDGRAPPRGGRFAKLLVPLDGSPASESILPHAAALAALWSAHVRLVRVVGDRADVAHATDQLADVRARVVAMAPTATVETDVLVRDDAAAAILARARHTGAQLVALATRGHGLTRLVLGSVADAILRGSDVPLLLRRPPLD